MYTHIRSRIHFLKSCELSFAVSGFLETGAAHNLLSAHPLAALPSRLRSCGLETLLRPPGLIRLGLGVAATGGVRRRSGSGGGDGGRSSRSSSRRPCLRIVLVITMKTIIIVIMSIILAVICVKCFVLIVMT